MAKSTKPMIRIHNLETNEIIDREMNDQELAQFEADKEIELTRLAAIESKTIEKQAILDRLGLTVDEAKLLLG
jgi:hypothetical protein